MIPYSSSGGQHWAQPSRLPGGGRPTERRGSTAPGSVPSLSETTSMATAPSQSNGQPSIPDSTTTAIDAGPPENENPAKRPKLEIPNLPTGTDGRANARIPDSRPTPTTSGPSRITAVSGRPRPAGSFQELVTETYNGALVGGPQMAKPQSPPPFPTRPWKGVPTDQPSNSGAATKDSAFDREVQIIAYRPEVPSVAPLLKEGKVADFSPWTGNHPEDILNEQTTKQGHYDRTQVSQNESNTARPSLYVQLKLRSGLQLLSSVFTAALERRQAHSKLTSSSTFKPPPRVTLTDNKRETWLRDLANESVPLRRLSRTIPHGIRGKVLLDQCVSKWIPIGRAVWLAKCVGANEIRAFKRKGTSGTLAQGLETKWVRDWTASVQQFLEAIIGASGQPEWKTKMTYAVRLTARLFYELLLDQDYFLDWYLHSLENCSLDGLPVWLLMVGIYWDHLVRYRKRARRLAELLLLKYHLATSAEPKHLIQPLIDRLALLIRKLAREQTSALVLPQCWDKYHDIVKTCLDADDSLDRAILDSLSVRNHYVRSLKDTRPDAKTSSQRGIARILDSARSGHDVSALSQECLDASTDRQALILELLEWAATPFRQGLFRVFIAVRLLRKWKKLGIDIDNPILSFLIRARDDPRLEMIHVYHIVVELVRSQTFSVSRYLQWLVARGAIDGSKLDGSRAVPSDVELLLQLPVGRLPQHARNLRNTLLGRAGLLPSEDVAIREVKNSIRKKLPELFRTDMDREDVMEVETEPKPLTWAVKAEVGQWIRSAVSDHYKQPSKLMEVRTSLIGRERSAFTPEEFFVVRDLLEEYTDLSMLADVLDHAANSDDSTVLASAVDTLNRHLECFNAIGATCDLYRTFFAAFARLKNSGAPTYDLLYSLIELGHRIPGEAHTVSVLRQEFARCDRRAAIAACSPMSDHMADNLNLSNPAFNEELDQFFSSGNSMDENTLASIFQTLSTQLESQEMASNVSSVNTTVRHLVQLRHFNAKQFDLLLIRWVEGIFSRTDRPRLFGIFVPLIGTGCMTVISLSVMLRKLMQGDATRSSIPDPGGLYSELLEILVPITSPKWENMVSYRARMSQEEFLWKYPQEVLAVIQDTAFVFSTQGPSSGSDFQFTLEKYVSPLLKELMVQHPEAVTQRTLQDLVKLYPALSDTVRRTLDLIIGVNPLSGNNFLSAAEQTINSVNNFSLPFCQLKLQLLFNSDDGEEFRHSIADVMFKAAVADIRSGRSNWLDLAALMSDEVVQQLRQSAEKGFFSMFSVDPIESDPLASSECSSRRETAQVYLAIIDGLAYSISEGGAASIAPLLVEKINILLQKLVLAQTNVRNAGETPGDIPVAQTIESLALFEQNFTFWFTALLHMVVINLPALSGSLSSSPSAGPAKPAASRPEQMRLIISICCIALSKFPVTLMSRPCSSGYVPSLGQTENLSRHDVSLQTHALDVVGCLLENLSDEARHHCVRYLRDRYPPFLHVQNDARLLYLLGPTVEMTASPSAQTVSASSPLPSGPYSALTPGGSIVSGSATGQAAGVTSAISSTGIGEDPNGLINRLRIQHRGRVVGPYPVRPWEMLEGAAPVVGANDTAIYLGYFGARRVKE